MKKQHSFLKETAHRFKAETPKYWKKIRNWSLAVVAGATGVLITHTTVDLGLPEIIMQVLKYIVAAGTFLGLGSQLTRHDDTTEVDN